MKNKQFQNQDTLPLRRVRNFIFSLVVSRLKKSPQLKRRVLLVGERAEYTTWVSECFGDSEFFYSRERLWKKMYSLLEKDCQYTVFEFGVAWGYTTDHWLNRYGQSIAVWNGFDRFTGLPRSWRDLQENTFDAGGKTPEILDSRISWHVGDVEECLPQATVGAGPKIIFFDLDLYEPTLFAWEYLKKDLRSGDLIYFDESFDSDERLIINQNVRHDFELTVIGFTHSAIAFKLGTRLTI